MDVAGQSTFDQTRLKAYDAVSLYLAGRSDAALLELLGGATASGSGIGGETASFEVGGTPIFAKRVRLSDVELQPDNLYSTANLFDLPQFCHYGIGTIGSPGFGAWRELAVHQGTTSWVLGGDHHAFPLMYHWRVLPDRVRPLPEKLADVDRAVSYWGGGPEIRRRIEGLQRSATSVVLFLEHIPHTVHDWLAAQIAQGGELAERACTMVDLELRAGVEFMNSHGLLHFDTHFENVLTDGERLYFADYGLALASQFDLGSEEAQFFTDHYNYDRSYTASYLVNWLAVALFQLNAQDRKAFVRSCANGMHPPAIAKHAAHIFAQHASTAAEMGDFIDRFEHEGRTTIYPSTGLDLTLLARQRGRLGQP